jgi:hypothetical protein
MFRGHNQGSDRELSCPPSSARQDRMRHTKEKSTLLWPKTRPPAFTNAPLWSCKFLCPGHVFTPVVKRLSRHCRPFHLFPVRGELTWGRPWVHGFHVCACAAETLSPVAVAPLRPQAELAFSPYALSAASAVSRLMDAWAASAASRSSQAPFLLTFFHR